MISLQEQRQLRELFGQALKERVKLDYFTQRPTAMVIPGREECPFCQDVETMLRELTALSPLFTLSVHEFGQGEAKELQKRYGVERVPATVIRGVLNRPVTIYGAPLGLLFSPLVETLAFMSQNRSNLPAAATRRLKRLHEPVNLLLFVTPDSPYCVPMLTAAFACAVETKLVHATAIEVTEFPRWAERYNVRHVPFTVLNDRVAFPGQVEPEVLADQIVKAATHRAISVQLPQSRGSTPVALGQQGQPQQQPRPTTGEVVRPSGLIIPGR